MPQSAVGGLNPVTPMILEIIRNKNSEKNHGARYPIVFPALERRKFSQASTHISTKFCKPVGFFIGSHFFDLMRTIIANTKSKPMIIHVFTTVSVIKKVMLSVILNPPKTLIVKSILHPGIYI